jgi:AbrB family looped-hinge helix DNA binding protein
MSATNTSTTVLSTKGQVILPKSIRDEKNWGPGARLTVESTREGVLLRQADRPFAPTTFDEVRGSLSGRGKSLTQKEIDEALRAAAKRRFARD